ncbi:MAG: hypothetical protein KGZ67_02160 [Hydrogenophaga sp.]|jgi:hypothetical protein|nr:hypothetical protein [Hydrogenophaga sp.]
MQQPESRLIKREKGTDSPRRSWGFIAGSVLAGVLTASCGGGDRTGEPPPTGVILDKANMLSIAHKANDSFVMFDLAMFASDFILWGNDWFDSGTAYQCLDDDENSGSVTFTTNSTTDAFQAGDVLTISYDDCQTEEDDPTRISGDMELRVQSVTGDATSLEIGQPWTYKLTVLYDKFTLLSPSERIVIEGKMKITESSPGVINTDLDEHITTHFESTSMRLTEDADTHTYSNAAGTLVSEHTAEGLWTATINTELISTTLAGKLSFVTMEPFKGVLDDPFPTRGLGRIDAGLEQQLQLRAQPTGVDATLITPRFRESFFINWTNF